MSGHQAIKLDLADIQGNILNAYGRLGFPKGRAILLHVDDEAVGRDFLHHFYPRVTTALRWPSSKPTAAPASDNAPQRPDVTLNFAFTFWGLFALGVPVRTLSRMPSEFVDGMRARAPLLGDDVPLGDKGPNSNALDHWDEVWKSETEANGPNNVHILALLNCDMNPHTGEPVAALDILTDEIRSFCTRNGNKIRILPGHGAGGDEFQELSAILTLDKTKGSGKSGQYVATPYEHFGFLDGISDPVFEGQFPEEVEAVRCIGNGKRDKKGQWRPLATGEFLFGYPDEAMELPPTAPPNAFSTNGTFMAYRKLCEKVDLFNTYLDETAGEFGKVYGIDDPAQARATLKAKFSGRWEDGVPLSQAPTYRDWINFNAENPADSDEHRNERLLKFTNYDYTSDPNGIACPLSAHTRRVNPRDSLGPEPPKKGNPTPSGTKLVNRRRILRRGLPYSTDSGGVKEQGIVMLICCADINRQYEFVQQQWLNYGMDNNAGNDTCPLLGARIGEDLKFVIPADPDKGHAPYICSKLPQFVETRGGAYFFVPSMTSLRLIAIGSIDST